MLLTVSHSVSHKEESSLTRNSELLCYFDINFNFRLYLEYRILLTGNWNLCTIFLLHSRLVTKNYNTAHSIVSIYGLHIIIRCGSNVHAETTIGMF